MSKIRNENTFNRISGGILVILLALFATLSVFGAFGGVGLMVKSFLLGLLGLSSYALSICLIMVGLAIIFRLRITLPFTKFLKYFSLLLIGILALHIFSSSSHILGRTYSEYVRVCFSSGNTAGGAIMAVVSFPLMKALTNAGALITVCLAFLGISLIYFFPLIRSEVTYQTRKSKVGTKIGVQKQPTITDFSTLAQEGSQSGARLFRVEVDAMPMTEEKKPTKKPKGADGYDPLFPNAQGHIEDDARFPEEQPYTESGLAKKILLSQQFDEEAYRRYVGGSGSASISKPSAPYATQKRIQMDGKLGIDRTGSGLRAEAERRFVGEEEEINSLDGIFNANSYQNRTSDEKGTPTENRVSSNEYIEKAVEEEAKDDSKLDFSNRKDYGGISIPELREKSEWGKKNYDPTQFKIEDLKKEEIDHYREVSSSSYVESKIDQNSNPTYIDATEKNSKITPLQDETKVSGGEKSSYIKPIVPREISTPIISANKSIEAKTSDDYKGSRAYAQNSNSDIVKAEIVNNGNIASSASRAVVMPPVSASPRFGSENLRDAVVRAASESSNQNEIRNKSLGRNENLSKSERLEKLERMRSERLARAEGSNDMGRGSTQSSEVANSNQSKTSKSKLLSKNEIPRAAQITIDESIEKTKVRSPYVAPPLSLLLDADADYGPVDDFEQKKEILVATLASFNIVSEVTDVVCGPTFSLYILQVTMPRGKTINWISVLDHDIAMKMEEVSVRILAPIPGKNAVGIEVPNKKRKVVRLKEILNSPKFNDDKSPFTFALGKNLYGDVFTADIKKLPHLLIAGATGSGKSCCINTLIVSLLYKATPDDLRLIMIDPKRVELKVYEKIPHLLMDEIIVDVDKAIKALQWVIKEMDRRTEFFSKNSYRDIDEYNFYGVKDGFPKMPRIAIIIDELADLMEMGKKAVEDSINRLARLARATGIHLIVATQRPSVDVISGTIKNNLPTRIAFKVTSGPDSKTVLDGGGADKLLGNGDLLLMKPSSPILERMQGAFITGEEVRNVVKFIREHNEGYFDNKAKEEIFAEDPPPEDKKDFRSNRANELPIEFFRALQIGLNGELISVTLLQRRLRIGFPKAGNIVDQLSLRGYLGEADSSNKGRKVLISHEQFEELLAEHNLNEDDLY
ncbi:MAG: DNA translocase FtsK [Clostridia bacterium]|nr:DNA translocase FtsK [Clostridia bacterium]